MDYLNTPILLLIFNRPDTTGQVFDTIRKAKPKKLYIAADGPRDFIAGESEICDIVRAIATNVEWDCELITLFRDQNLGCKLAVSEAITWFFNHEDRGIILEDDCYPEQTFFSYCQELLEYYRDDYRIMAISGDNFQNGIARTHDSYYFSRYNHVWGWASWRRAWSHYDVKMSHWPEVKATGLLSNVAIGDQKFVKYWTKIFDQCHKGVIDTWDYQWTFACWLQSALTILPNVNLISNIGFDEAATHTKKFDSKQAALDTSPIKLPLKHPFYVVRDIQADEYTEKIVLGLDNKESSIFRMLKKKMKKVLHWPLRY